MYTQIVAAVWAFLAWGQSYEFVVEGRGFLRASVFLALSWLSHLIVGYGVSAITVVLVLAAAMRDQSPPGERAVLHAVLRWLALNVATAGLISYLILPTLVEAHILNRSRFEPAEYWDSYGAETCLKWLFKVILLLLSFLFVILSLFFQGSLLDRVYNDGPWAAWVGNTPVFTLIVLLGTTLVILFALRDLLFEKRQVFVVLFSVFVCFIGFFEASSARDSFCAGAGGCTGGGLCSLHRSIHVWSSAAATGSL